MAIVAGLWLVSSDIRLARRALLWMRLRARRAARRYRAHRERRRRQTEQRTL